MKFFEKYDVDFIILGKNRVHCRSKSIKLEKNFTRIRLIFYLKNSNFSFCFYRFFCEIFHFM